jgi:mono/diheme cytochrome c family protein
MMNRSSIRIMVGVVCLGMVATLGAWLATVFFGNIGGNAAAELDKPADQELVDRGAYLAVLGDCAACHTAPNGQRFAGGLPIATPIGVVYTTNITPDKTGIGRYSFGDFERAVRRGIKPDGTSLYPAMPYPSYARVSDADIQALYAYFTNGVRPVVHADKAPEIAWPFSVQWPLTYWRWLFGPAVQSSSVTFSGDALSDRGAYLVEGLGHCGTCHTPRGLGLQERALTTRDGPQYLSGGLVDNYVANNLRGDALTGLGAWSEAEIVQFLQTGRNSRTAAFGGMSDVVVHSTEFMNEEDLRAMAHFLKSLPPTGNETGFAYQTAAASALESGNVSARGALDYVNNCAACHRSAGKGYTETFPALAGNPVVNTADPVSAINIVLNGGTVPSTSKAPTHFTMPAFGDRLTDQEVADLLTFIRSSWGNNAPPVDASRVARVRQLTHAPTTKRSQ